MIPAHHILVVEDSDEDFETVLDAARRAGVTHEHLRVLPLVVLSTSSNPRDLEFCLARGANAYHVKPVVHAEHLQVLETIFAYWLTRVILPAQICRASSLPL